MDAQINTPNKKRHWLEFMFLVLFFGLFIIWPMASGLWSNSTKETRPPCTNTTRNVQTIVKVDGAVDSVATETVDGCETPDGTFYKRPDF